MPVEILLPAFSADTTEVKLASWLVQEGDSVEPGDVLVEVETDKAMLEVESEHKGTVGKILVPANGAAYVGQRIALILQDGEGLESLNALLNESNVNSQQKVQQNTDVESPVAMTASAAAPVEVLLPAFSADANEATVASWLVKEGDSIERGDVLVEVETDKAMLEVESEHKGTLGKILVPAGCETKVGQCIALILQEGSNPEALEAFSNNSQEEAQQSDAIEPVVAAKPVDDASEDVSALDDRVLASPLARRMAGETSIDLSQLTGSGPGGRVVKRDVEAVLHNTLPTTVPVAATPTPISPSPVHADVPATTVQIPTSENRAYDEIPNSGIRKIIAKRLGEAKQEIPHFYLNVDVELDALVDMRKELNLLAKEGRDSYKLSVNDFVIKAAALALRDVPEANASWTEEAVLRYHDVDISVAVATDTGLITPIIRGADQKGLITLSADVKALAQKARDGRLSPQEYQGGGFTISNLGMYGIKQFSAIVNPPQSCILAVGAGEQRAVVKDGELAVATVMSCTLSVDHRSVDGAVGAQFFKAFKGYMEHPMSMNVVTC